MFGYYQVDSQQLGEILLQDVVSIGTAGTPESALINAPASAVIRNNFPRLTLCRKF